MPSLRLTLTLSKNPARKDGSLAVWLRIHLDKRLYFNTGFSVQEKDWDQEKERIRRDPQTTAALHAIKARAQKIYTDAVVTGQPITSQAIRDQLSGAPAADFLAWAGEQIEADAKLSRSSKAQHRTLINLLREFAGGGLAFTEINYSFVVRSDNFLSSRTTSRGKPAGRNYVAKMLGLFRRNINMAIRHGKLAESPFFAHKIQQGPTKKVWCTKDEVMALTSVDTRNWKGKARLVQELFRTQFYTGCRFSDALNLTRENLRWDDDGPTLWLDYTPKKTSRRKRPARVLFSITEVWGREAESFFNNLLARANKNEGRLMIDTIDNGVANKNLCRLALAAGINKAITTHSGRHSCAMYLLNERGLDFGQVAKVLGHSDIKMTQEYADYLPASIGRKWDNGQR